MKNLIFIFVFISKYFLISLETTFWHTDWSKMFLIYKCCWLPYLSVIFFWLSYIMVRRFIRFQYLKFMVFVLWPRIQSILIIVLCILKICILLLSDGVFSVYFGFFPLMFPHLCICWVIYTFLALYINVSIVILMISLHNILVLTLGITKHIFPVYLWLIFYHFTLNTEILLPCKVLYNLSSRLQLSYIYVHCKPHQKILYFAFHSHMF